MKVSLEQLLTRGVAEVIEKDHLEKALKSGKKLRVKFGIDPTAPDLHLGHTVPLRKLRQFQDAGHKAILIIGDFTAQIGDPTGRTEIRKPLSEKEVKQNMKKYLNQAGKILDIKKAEIRYNSEWFKKEGLEAAFELYRAGTIQQVLHRADFRKRLDEGKDITVMEIMYPLFQGYDSVKVGADVEIGGTDQKFNLLMGRRVQRHFKMPEQDILTLPLLEGTDGIRKMSKSFGNYIGLDEEPEIMFGKIMSIPDNLINKYYELCTDGERKISDPREAKLELARNIVEIYHGKNAGQKAKGEFIRVFSEHKAPSEAPIFKVGVRSIYLAWLLASAKMASSTSEARRLIEQGGVKINGEKQTDVNKIIRLEKGKEILLQVGKHRFLTIIGK